MTKLRFTIAMPSNRTLPIFADNTTSAIPFTDRKNTPKPEAISLRHSKAATSQTINEPALCTIRVIASCNLVWKTANKVCRTFNKQ